MRAVWFVLCFLIVGLVQADGVMLLKVPGDDEIGATYAHEASPASASSSMARMRHAAFAGVSKADKDVPATGVLLWAPTVRQTYYNIGHVTNAISVLTDAYGTIIPTNELFCSQYPSGIHVSSLTGTPSDPASLPTDLDSYALVFVIFPYATVGSNEVAQLKTVVNRGGRVVLQGEHGSYCPEENAYLTKLAKNMGADFKILSGDSLNRGDDTFNYACDLLAGGLTNYPTSNRAAPISYSGYAQEVAHTTHLGTNYIWAVDETSGKGRITAFSDMNWYLASNYDEAPALYTDSIPFLERLLSNAIANEQNVINEDYTNHVEVVVPAGMVAAVRDNNSYLQFYETIAEACSAAAPFGFDVLLETNNYYESFTLPVGVTFITTDYCTNYDAYISAPTGYTVLANDRHDIFKVAGIPPAPRVEASDGSYTDCVHVVWSAPTNNIVAYKIRCVNMNTGYEKDLEDNFTGCEYDDKTAKPGVHYTYYVSAKNDAGWGFEGSDEGWRNVSAAAGVANVTARQRYPWNGKVDVDFEVTGDSEVTYLLELTATDLGGGTNLPVRTVLGETRVSPGQHRLVWNADSDLSVDVDLSRVRISVTATEE